MLKIVMLMRIMMMMRRIMTTRVLDQIYQKRRKMMQIFCQKERHMKLKN